LKRILLTIGDVVVSGEPAILETTLGSCVSVCLWHEKTRTGGMNHFIFPEMTAPSKDPAWYGTESMSRLINHFLRAGIPGRYIKAKVFGGGIVIRGFHQRFDVGKENTRVAKEILTSHGIPVVSEVTGMDCGIKVVFYSATGRAFVKRIEG
jgi:chemotaxis protein CheD